jgi:lipid A disaccharide synthetase
VVPELLQYEVNAQRISEELYRLLFDETTRQTTLKEFAAVRAKLGKPGASQRAAELAYGYLRKD